MTTTAGDTDRGGERRHVVRSLALHGAGTIVALVLLPVFVLFGAPLAAWAIGAGAVLANRVIGAVAAWSVRDASTSVILGVVGFSIMGRALATALLLFFVGAEVGAAGDRTVGLGRPDLATPAILLFLLAYTVDAGIEAIRRAAAKEREAAQHFPTPVETNA